MAKLTGDAKILWGYWRKHPTGYNNVVYIRGTKAGFEHVAEDTRTFFATSDNVEKGSYYRSNIDGLVRRYRAQRKQVLAAGGKPGLSAKEIDAIEEGFFEGVNEALNRSTSDLPSVDATAATALRKMQEFINQRKNDEHVKVISETLGEIEEMEKRYASLSDNDKRLIQSIINPENMEGQVVRLTESGLSFLEMFKNVLYARLGESSFFSEPNISTMQANNSMGALEEAIQLFMIGKSDQAVISAMERATKSSGMGNIKSTGNFKRPGDTGGTAGTATADGVFTFNATMNGDTFTYQEGVSVKTSGSLIDENGKWVKTKTPHYITIKDISEQQAAWDMLCKAFSRSGKLDSLAENSLLNGIVWLNGNAKERVVMKKHLAASSLERLISGSGKKMSNHDLFDQASVMIVNGVPIPVRTILEEAMKRLRADSKQAEQIIGLSINSAEIGREAKWNNPDDFKDITAAVERSRRARDFIQKSLKFTFTLNGNFLYDIAKSMRLT